MPMTPLASSQSHDDARGWLSRLARRALGLDELHSDVRRVAGLVAHANHRLRLLGADMSTMREEFDRAKAELGGAITGLADRIDGLDADNLTAADIADLKADAASLRNLAVADPDIPTDPAGPTPAPVPTDPGTPGTDEPVDPEVEDDGDSDDDAGTDTGL